MFTDASQECTSSRLETAISHGVSLNLYQNKLFHIPEDCNIREEKIAADSLFM
jgi:hypothetical protein